MTEPISKHASSGNKKFDEFSRDYDRIHNENIQISGESTEYFSEYKIKSLSAFFRKNHLPPNFALLDLGCGIGKVERYFLSYFPQARVYGIDPSLESVRVASRSVAEASFLVYDGTKLPFREKSFDAILLACVLHHVPPPQRVSLLKTILDALKPEGFLFIFEHNPFNPLTRYAVNTCPFDTDAQLLTRRSCLKLIKPLPLSISETRYIVFFPAFLNFLRRFEPYLAKIPLGAQYFIAARKAARIQ